MQVKLLKHYRIYNAGERIGVSEAEADALISAGDAQAVVKPAVVKELAVETRKARRKRPSTSSEGS